MANPHPVSRKGKHNKYASARVERALAEGKKLPPEDLLALATNCMAMAARYAPMRIDEKTQEPVENRAHDYDRYMECMRDARECLKAAAPYYSPRLMAVAFAPAVPSADAATELDPRALLFREYMQMRQRGELAAGLIEQQRKKKRPIVIDHEPTPKPFEDDGDGVAE